MKYLPTGEMVEVVQKLDSGEWLVETKVVCGPDDICFYEGQLRIVPEVFDCAPVAILDKEIEIRQTTLRSLEGLIKTTRNDLVTLENNHLERIRKISSYKGLENIENFIGNKITHVVTKRYSVIEIFTREELTTKNEYDERPTLKLLSLFGNSDGDLFWRINEYKDGSGSGWYEAWPFCSELEARNFAQELINKNSIGEENSYYFQYLMDSALKLNLEVPSILRQKVEEKRRKDKEAQILDLENKLSKIKNS